MNEGRELKYNYEQIEELMLIVTDIINELELALDSANKVKEDFYSKNQLIGIADAKYYLGYAGNEISDFCENIYLHIEKLKTCFEVCYNYMDNSKKLIKNADEKIARMIQSVEATY